MKRKLVAQTAGAKRSKPKEDVEALEIIDTAPSWIKQGQIIGDSLCPIQSIGLSDKIYETLQSSFGISNWFAMQAEVIPAILTARLHKHDVCVSSPTGSGKTLAYVTPIVSVLSSRLACRLRALVLLPTRDLARQVFTVFQSLCAPLGLHVALATGQQSFVEEQQRIVGLLTPEQILAGGNSVVDILVCTPGRLMDHLQSTPGFTLQHLEFLVLDEADRLLNQSYSDWAFHLLQSAQQPLTGRFVFDPIRGVIADAVAAPTSSSTINNTRFQTLLFSATLTRNPQKLGSLRLRNPLFITASKKKIYATPAGLKQNFIVCQYADKPLVLLHLLLNYDTPTIVFASSVQGVHRLYRLFELLGCFSVAEYSSALPQTRRTHLLAELRAGNLRVVICSDVMARGLDVEGIALVINYDVPLYARTYVHRVGRTARGGQEGLAFTLCRREEVRHFRELQRQTESVDGLQQVTVDRVALQPLKKRHLSALHALKEVLAAESAREQLPHAPLNNARLRVLRERYPLLTAASTAPAASASQSANVEVDADNEDDEAEDGANLFEEATEEAAVDSGRDDEEEEDEEEEEEEED